MSLSRKRSFLDSQAQPNDGVSVSKSKTVLSAKTSTGFVEGSIVRVKLNHFLTYDSVEFHTGPYLNVIIGPNGTGKSAIVCAICLGLAGKTGWLGRASEPRDFIQTGRKEALIEIELFNPSDQRNYIVTRKIYSNSKTQWLVNGKTATQEKVKELVLSLNIQVGNLCQFLPQEKVADFARMTQQELLENTEKSVDSGDLYKKHEKLIKARQTARTLENDVSKLEEELDLEKQKNARLEQDVQIYKDRKAFLEKVEVLKMKKPWLEYHLLKEQYERGNEEKNKKADELKNAKKQFAPLQRKHDQVKEEKEELEKVTREMSQQIRSKAKDLEAQGNSMINKGEKIEEAKAEFDSKLKDEEVRKKKLNDLQEQLKSLELGLAEMDGSDAQMIARNLEKTADELRRVNTQMTGVQNEGERLRREINTIKGEIRDNENQIRQIQDVNNSRLETLRTLHQNTYEAVVWLRSNKHLFKKVIHEPMIICLNVANRPDAKLVESLISFNDLRSFVCEDPDDLKLFLKKVKGEQKLRVNAIEAPPEAASQFQPRFPISYYRKFGFERYMQNLFTCPEPVMRYLCKMYKVHNIPIGSNDVKNSTDRIKQECPELVIFYTPFVQYSIKRSKYTNFVAARNTAVREARALADSINMEREQELKRAIKDSTEVQRSKEEEYKVLQKKSEEFERKINDLREQKRNLMKHKDERKSVENQIITKKQRIQKVISEEVNLETEERKLQAQLKKIVMDKFRHLEKMRSISVECVNIAKKRAKNSLHLAERVREFSHLETELYNVRQKYDNLEREVEELKEHVKDLKQQARGKLLEAKRVARIELNDDLEEQLRQRGVWDEFDKASNVLDTLENQIHSMQARAESMFRVDEQVVQEFENRERDIARRERELSERESQRQTHQEDISETRRQWLEPLQRLIAQINTNFLYFFSCLHCCGEVSLSVPQNPEDYEKYGICIKVKFRDDENLRELTAHHQSGGERSVSTVLFMMALQELTKCPFRCVDEINQGMDPNNERKIFQLVVQTVCKRTGSQYFLLTPKLLPDLEYDENMTVLCVYNGPYMMGHKQWNLKEFISRRKAIED